MRLALIVLALPLAAASSAGVPALAAPPAATAAPGQARTANAFLPSRICSDDLKPRHARSRPAAGPKRLGELPPGDLTLAVVNRVGDCLEPVIVRHGIGNFGR